MKEHARELSPPATPEERRREICRRLDERGRLDVEALAAAWRLQPITIRRDFEALAAEGLLIRVRGGAVRNDRVRLEFGYSERLRQHAAAKQAIAAAAAALVAPGHTLLFDAGTTTQLLARALNGRADLQIVTNNLMVVVELRGALGVEVVLLGGQARRGGFELVGPVPERLLADIRADFAFLGADAVDPESGFYTTDLGVARLEQLMIAAAKRTVVLADASKLGRRGFVRYAGFDQVDTWITAGALPAPLARKLRKRGLELIVADS